MKLVFESAENAFPLQDVDGVPACSAAEAPSYRFVVSEAVDGGNEGGKTAGLDDESRLLDDPGDLCAWLRRGDDGSAAGKHAGELGGHDQVCGVFLLGQQVNVGQAEEGVEPLHRLQGKLAQVGDVGGRLFVQEQVAILRGGLLGAVRSWLLQWVDCFGVTLSSAWAARYG